jgi:hypothetical protein
MPRWLHRLYAAALGYFWLPCPICGRMFGGHEITDASVSVPDPARPGALRIACPRHYRRAVYLGVARTAQVGDNRRARY